MKPLPFVALIVAVACGGEKNSQLFDDPGGGATGGTGGKGAGGSTGGAAAGKGQGGGGPGGAGNGGAASGGAGTGGKGGGAGKGGSAGNAGSAAGLGGAGAGGPAGGQGGGPAGASGRGMAAGGRAGSAGTGGKAGAATCEGLVESYAETIEKALACDVGIDSEQCTEHVAASLPCGCTIHVNPVNEDALSELRRLSEQHTAMGCVVACTDVECVERVAVCTSSGNGSMGRCVETDTPE
jgi:hypothetical protein